MTRPFGDPLPGQLPALAVFSKLQHAPLAAFPALVPPSGTWPGGDLWLGGDALRELIETLPVRQREAVRLKFIAGLDYQQISAAMQTSIGNVGYLIHHGVAALKTKWQAHDQPQAVKLKHAIA
jgi:DNA-directed RNA polymerase specialized sigma24 family protein